MNKKADISITLLVLGIVTICFLTIFSFIKTNNDRSDDFQVKLLHSLSSPLACIKEAVGLALDGLCGPLNRKQTKILKIAMKHIKKLVEIMEGILKEDKRN